MARTWSRAFAILSIIGIACGGPGTAEVPTTIVGTSPTSADVTTTSVSGMSSTSAAGQAREDEFSNVEQIREAVESTGYRCAYFEKNDPTSAVDWLEEGICSEQVSFFILRDQAAVDAQIADVNRKVNDFLNSVSVQIRGSNWIVNCTDRVALCEGFNAVLGGDLIVSEP